jgi:hypothetical protein
MEETFVIGWVGNTHAPDKDAEPGAAEDTGCM